MAPAILRDLEIIVAETTQQLHVCDLQEGRDVTEGRWMI